MAALPPIPEPTGAGRRSDRGAPPPLAHQTWRAGIHPTRPFGVVLAMGGHPTTSTTARHYSISRHPVGAALCWFEYTPLSSNLTDLVFQEDPVSRSFRSAGTAHLLGRNAGRPNVTRDS